MNCPPCSGDCRQGRDCPCPDACLLAATDDDIADLYDWRVLIGLFVAIAVIGVAFFI